MRPRTAATTLLPALLLLTSCASVPEAPPPPPSDSGGLWEILREREIVDLTHTLDEKVPFWPGTNYFPLKTWTLARFEEVRAFSRAYSLPEHYGTHVDAPVHFAEGQASIEGVLPGNLVGPAVVFDIRGKAALDPDAVLTPEDVDAWEALHGPVPRGAIVLLRTGWGARWGDMKAYRNFDAAGRLRFPSYGLEAARRLLVDRGCRGLGIDALSVDRGIDAEFPVHRMGSALGRWFLENVAALDRLPPTGAVVVVAPLPLRGGSGAQARVLAFLPSSKQ